MHATTHDKKLGMIIRYILKKHFGIKTLYERRSQALTQSVVGSNLHKLIENFLDDDILKKPRPKTSENVSKSQKFESIRSIYPLSINNKNSDLRVSLITNSSSKLAIKTRQPTRAASSITGSSIVKRNGVTKGRQALNQLYKSLEG